MEERARWTRKQAGFFLRAGQAGNTARNARRKEEKIAIHLESDRSSEHSKDSTIRKLKISHR